MLSQEQELSGQNITLKRNNMHYEIQQAVETLYDSQDILMKRVPLGNIDEILGELAKAQKIIEEVIKEIEELNR